jgi:hypothetical protein
MSDGYVGGKGLLNAGQRQHIMQKTYLFRRGERSKRKAGRNTYSYIGLNCVDSQIAEEYISEGATKRNV